MCDASDVKPSRRGEMPQCVRSESTKEGKGIRGVGGEQGGKIWVNQMNCVANKKGKEHRNI